jgi:hypothetical protein
MPHGRGLGSRVRVENDFVEADLDTAFALLYAAEMQSVSGDRAGALQAIDEAENAIMDGSRRLTCLDESDRERLRNRLNRMHAVIEGTRSGLQ